MTRHRVEPRVHARRDDMHAFDPRGANEAGFPWETNYARIRPEYFDAADQRLRHLIEQAQKEKGIEKDNPVLSEIKVTAGA